MHVLEDDEADAWQPQQPLGKEIDAAVNESSRPR